MWIGRTLPPEPGDEKYVDCVVHFSTVEPGGGAFVLRPRSHHFVQKCLEDPELRKRVLAQEFKQMDGLQEPKEMCVPAGSGCFSTRFLCTIDPRMSLTCREG